MSLYVRRSEAIKRKERKRYRRRGDESVCAVCTLHGLRCVIECFIHKRRTKPGVYPEDISRAPLQPGSKVDTTLQPCGTALRQGVDGKWPLFWAMTVYG